MVKFENFVLLVTKENKEGKEKRKTLLPPPVSAQSNLCRFRELRPVCAELKFHRNASDHADRKIDPERARPKARRLIVVLISSVQSFRLQVDDQKGQPHRKLRE